MSQAQKLATVRSSLAAFTSTNANNVVTAENITTEDITGRIVVVRWTRYNSAYWNQDRRLYVIGGAGCEPTNIGGEVFGVSLLDGGAEKWDRGAFSGIANNTAIPSGITIPTAQSTL